MANAGSKGEAARHAAEVHDGNGSGTRSRDRDSRQKMDLDAQRHRSPKFGDVAKAPHGWSLGLQRYDIVVRADWMDEPVGEIWGTASHQNEVLTLSPACRIRAASAFTPHAILAYEDRPALSFQFHPDFSRALFRMRRAPDLSPDQIAHAIASLATANDHARLARWMNLFSPFEGDRLRQNFLSKKLILLKIDAARGG